MHWGDMGQLAIVLGFILISIPADINDNRRHVHIFFRRKGARRLKSVAKIWIEKDGVPFVEIAYSSLTKKENDVLLKSITDNWDFINDQISKTFNGEKTIVRKLK